jgi:hypothetical protein
MIVLGWREWVALPDLGLARVRAKVDTGARSSALHVEAQWRFHDGGVPWVGFHLRRSRLSHEVVECNAPVHDEREVTDSGGHRTRRVFLRSTLQVAGHARSIEVNLAHRGSMRYPMLVGRSALTGMFTVDPAQSSLHGRPPAASPRTLA